MLVCPLTLTRLSLQMVMHTWLCMLAMGNRRYIAIDGEQQRLLNNEINPKRNAGTHLCLCKPKARCSKAQTRVPSIPELAYYDKSMSDVRFMTRCPADGHMDYLIQLIIWFCKGLLYGCFTQSLCHHSLLRDSFWIQELESIWNWTIYFRNICCKLARESYKNPKVKICLDSFCGNYILSYRVRIFCNYKRWYC